MREVDNEEVGGREALRSMLLLLYCLMVGVVGYCGLMFDIFIAVLLLLIFVD